MSAEIRAWFLDIETDDIEAEVRRLERLSAKRVTQAGTWSVLEAPTGQRFCVVKAPRPDAPGFCTWNARGNPCRSGGSGLKARRWAVRR